MFKDPVALSCAQGAHLDDYMRYLSSSAVRVWKSGMPSRAERLMQFGQSVLDEALGRNELYEVAREIFETARKSMVKPREVCNEYIFG